MDPQTADEPIERVRNMATKHEKGVILLLGTMLGGCGSDATFCVETRTCETSAEPDTAEIEGGDAGSAGSASLDPTGGSGAIEPESGTGGAPAAAPEAAGGTGGEPLPVPASGGTDAGPDPMDDADGGTDAMEDPCESCAPTEECDPEAAEPCSCPSGFASCSSDPQAVCETNLNEDRTHCGACSFACAGSLRCTMGACEQAVEDIGIGVGFACARKTALPTAPGGIVDCWGTNMFGGLGPSGGEGSPMPWHVP